MHKLNRLKKRIKEKKCTYSKLSKALGISLSAFNNKMNGRSAFDIVEVSQLSSILDIYPEEIMYFFA